MTAISSLFLSARRKLVSRSTGDLSAIHLHIFGPLFDGSFKESSEKVVAISEHTPEIFDQFLGFAYSKNLDCTAFQAPGEDEKWIAYSRLYALA